MADTAPDSEIDDYLVRRIQAGDDAAFERLVEHCGPRVYALVYRMIGHREDAQDVVQEVFLRVYQSLPRFRAESSFNTWMYRIVVNLCHDELDRRRRSPRTISEIEVADADTPIILLEQMTNGETPEDLCIRSERQYQLERLILQLPAQHRILVLLHDIQGMRYDEIATVLNMNVGTVKSRLNRAHHQLREKILEIRELFGLQTSQS